jgi:hypothetical protein
MVVSDRDRRDLFSALQQHLGQGPADTMMELLPPIGWSEVATKADLEVLAKELRAEMRAQFARMVYANIGLTLSAGGLAFAAARLA